jgi:hypothetical protein
MINVIGAGIIGIIAALAGSQFGYDLLFSETSTEKSAEAAEELKQEATELTGVPIILDNKVMGYVVLRVTSVVDVAKLPTKEFSSAPFILDAAFRSTYAFAEHGFSRVRPSDIERLSEQIKKDANSRIGAEAVKSVSLEQFNFVEKSQIRGQIIEPQH